MPLTESLTDALLEPVEHGLSVDECQRLGALARGRLTSDPRLRGACGRLGGGDLVATRRGRRRSFSWSARAAGRRLGLEALAAVVRSPGLSLAPSEAVGLAVANLLRGDPAEGSSLSRWARAWDEGAAAFVAAEATTWCTRLLCAVDWDQVGPSAEFAAERWWRPGPPPGLVLQTRPDVVVASGHTETLLSVQTGCPTAQSRLPLAYAGLVGVLDQRGAQRGARIPARVVGFWPDCGRWVRLDLDQAALGVALEATVVAAARRARRAYRRRS